jgi:hypothetical protein
VGRCKNLADYTVLSAFNLIKMSSSTAEQQQQQQTLYQVGQTKLDAFTIPN